MQTLRPPFLLFVYLLISTCPAGAQVNVLTAHNDNGRTGLNPNETVLNPVTVSSNGFGKIFSQAVDGPIYAQPLYVSNLPIPGKGTHNVVFAATMHDTMYAFDADNASGPNAAPLWQTSFINPAAGITAPLTTDATDSPFQDCRTFVGEIGIVGTPVIDLAANTIYVVARTKEPLPPPNNSTLVQYHRLHALNLSTGTEQPNSPVIIDAIVPGTGAGSSSGQIRFDQKHEIQRPALLLANGAVYVSFCSYCDLDPYHGWIVGYNASTLQRVGAFNVTPDGVRGGIWMGGAGLAADPNGAIYCVTGNGSFDTSANPRNFGDSFLKLTQGADLVLADYFTPYNQSTMDSADEDLGSSGALALPDSAGSQLHPHLLVGCSKLGKLYIVDRDAMGHFNPLNDSQIVQSANMFTSQPSTPHFFGAPAFYHNRLYVQGVGEYLKSYAFNNGQLDMSPLSTATETLGFRGATPSISSDGLTNGIVWQLAPTASVNPSFRAYDAEDLSHKLYDSYLSSQAGLPDVLSFVKFVVPTIANGKVYLGTINSLAVFGLRTIIRSATRNPSTGTIHLVYTAPQGIATTVQASPDLVQWITLGAGTAGPNGTFTYDVPISQANPAQFYRIR